MGRGSAARNEDGIARTRVLAMNLWAHRSRGATQGTFDSLVMSSTVRLGSKRVSVLSTRSDRLEPGEIYVTVGGKRLRVGGSDALALALELVTAVERAYGETLPG